MKTLYLVLLTLFLAAFSIPALNASDDYNGESCHTGSWYDPLNPGEGLAVEVLADGYTVAYFYTYDGFGRQTWYVYQGPDSQNLTAYDLLGGETYDVGSGSIAFTSDNDAYFVYHFMLDLDLVSAEQPIPWCLHSGCEGEIPLKRLTQPVPCE